MKSHTVYRTFQTESRRELIRITEDVQSAVDEAGVAEGLALVTATLGLIEHWWRSHGGAEQSP